MTWATEPKEFSIAIQVPLRDPVQYLRIDIRHQSFPTGDTNALIVTALREFAAYIESRQHEDPLEVTAKEEGAT